MQKWRAEAGVKAVKTSLTVFKIALKCDNCMWLSKKSKIYAKSYME